ncbi:unnamed protein product [Lactuca virosa]|uniref:RING-type E3 ubiquitin transferase n=1 Tax=Lactuca virosa TaxID=75947 RepID=A0AAU9LRL1_9ASTR|nr:unnamed protein product [Lactuca virosa]
MAETPTTASEINTEISTAPLLTQQSTHESLFGGARTLTTLSIFFGLLSGPRGDSLKVRESAAQQLENWRDDWGYSLPVVAIDTTWNLAVVVVSIAMLFWTAREQPNMPVRAWICVYALQCVMHVVLVLLDYRRRNRRAATASSDPSDRDRISFRNSSGSDVTSAEKIWETFNKIFQYLWWLVAFCWLIPNFEMHSAPHLFWLTLTFMVIDVFLAAIGFLLKGVITGLAVSFCLPCVLSFLDFMGCQGGASEAEISVLPKYRFVVHADDGGRMVPFETNDPDFSRVHVLPLEEEDCCICLYPYEDGTKLHLLPCNHHFHVKCILKWLKITTTCPLCSHTICQRLTRKITLIPSICFLPNLKEIPTRKIGRQHRQLSIASPSPTSLPQSDYRPPSLRSSSSEQASISAPIVPILIRSSQLSDIRRPFSFSATTNEPSLLLLIL